jgi:hypothetical protein
MMFTTTTTTTTIRQIAVQGTTIAVANQFCPFRAKGKSGSCNNKIDGDEDVDGSLNNKIHERRVDHGPGHQLFASRKRSIGPVA